MIAIPYSKKKQYLSGMDWLVYCLDYINKRATGIGTPIQLMLEFECILDAAVLEQALHRISKAFPVLFGMVKRDYNAAPYWDIPKQGKKAISLKVSHVDDRDHAMSILYEEMHIPWQNNREHIKFHLVNYGESSSLGVVFDHCLFDDCGAELFLGVVHRSLCGETISCTESFAVPPQLSLWKEKFVAGQQVNRFFRALHHGATIVSFDGSSHVRIPKNCFKVHTFTVQESKEIWKVSEREAGYLMIMPYLLSRTAIAMQELYQSRNQSEGDMVVPVSINMRRDNEKKGFFNHVSFMFYRIQGVHNGDMQKIIADIKQQMYAQVKNDILNNLMNASLLMRIVPVCLFHHVVRLPFFAAHSSFSFAALVKSFFDSANFGVTPIRNVYHLPRIPLKPGVGVFFTQYKEKITFTISYSEGVLADNEVDTLSKKLVKSLGGL